MPYAQVNKNYCKPSLSMVEKKKETKKIEVTEEEIINILKILDGFKRKLQGTLNR
jgi:hypothetical protein